MQVYIESMNKKPDLICLSEHWMKKEEEIFIRIEGYKLGCSFARLSMKHGGACIFGREDLHLEEETNIVQRSVEGIIECAAVVAKCLRLLVVCVYRRGLGSFETFIDKLEEILDYIRVKYVKFKLVLAGDFNLNMLVKTVQNDLLIDLLSGYNLKQTIFAPTREAKNSSTLIDNIFVNIDRFSAAVIENALSDHHAQLISFRSEQVVPLDYKYVTKRIYSRKRLLLFRQELQIVDWSPVLECNDVNVCYNTFISKIKCLMNVIFPIKKYNCKKFYNGWITKGIKISCKNKRKLYCEKKEGKVSNDEYKKYEKILRKVILEAKRKSNAEFILNSDNKTRATWSLVRKISENPQKNSIIDTFAPKYGTSVTALNALNNYFINSCPDVDSSGTADSFPIAGCQRTIFLEPTSVEEVCRCIKNLKNKKSVGEDQVPVSLLKETADIISIPLEHVINVMFSTGIFPEQLKLAHIKAIYKKGDRAEEKNYRPVSLLSNVNKVFEKILYSRLISFIERNAILADRQNGFSRHKSTIRAIYQAMSEILNSLNDDRVTVAMLLDLTKAFDSVNHSILCLKLEKYGIRGVALQLIKSYLKSRTQCVVEVDPCGGIACSKRVIIKKGVPQGSILGPLLYILYTNELPRVSHEYMVLYADDTTLIFKEDNKDLLLQKMVNTLDLVRQYFASNDLLLNISKTQTILFSNRSNERVTVTYDNIDVVSGNEILFLGVTVDRRLDWGCHVSVLASNMAKYCCALRVILDYVGEDAALSSYYAYIHSRMRYGIIFWGNSCEISRILVLQKRCLRVLYRMKARESCKNVFISKRIFTVISLYIYEAVLFVHNNKDLFQECIRAHEHNTRLKNDLKPNVSKYSYIQKNVHFCILRLYNSFPNHVRILRTNCMKLVIKNYLVRKAFYSLEEFFADESRLFLCV